MSNEDRRREECRRLESESGGRCWRCKTRPVGIINYTVQGLDLPAALCWVCIYRLLDFIGVPIHPEWQDRREARIKETEERHAYLT